MKTRCVYEPDPFSPPQIKTEKSGLAMQDYVHVSSGKKVIILYKNIKGFIDKSEIDPYVFSEHTQIQTKHTFSLLSSTAFPGNNILYIISMVQKVAAM